MIDDYCSSLCRNIQNNNALNADVLSTHFKNQLDKCSLQGQAVQTYQVVLISSVIQTLIRYIQLGINS